MVTTYKVNYKRSMAKRVPKGSFKKRMPFSKKQVKAIKTLAQRSGEKMRERNQGTSTNIFDNTPLSLQCIQSVSQGDAQGNRQGDEILPISLSCRGYVKCTGTTEALVRVMCIQYKNDTLLTSADVPAPEEFFPDPDETTSRYSVLFDRVYALSPNGKDIHFIKFNLKKFSKVKFDEGVTTINSGDIYIYVQGDLDTATGSGIEARLQSKVLYVDN